MNIRWYKNGKLDKPIYKTPNVKSDIKVAVGDSVVLAKGSIYYNTGGSKNTTFENNYYWGKTDIKVRGVVADVKYIETQYYNGYVIQLKSYWPWFQLDDSVIVIK